MDIRFIAWAGYQFAQTGGGEVVLASVCPPDFFGEDVGDIQIVSDNITNSSQLNGKELKPKLVAYPRPTA